MTEVKQNGNACFFGVVGEFCQVLLETKVTTVVFSQSFLVRKYKSVG
jgi:hypothetical protein